VPQGNSGTVLRLGKDLFLPYRFQLIIYQASPPESCPFEVEISVANLKRYKSPDSDEIAAELLQAGGETLCSELHKLINSI
jgi:hypothetical protein